CGTALPVGPALSIASFPRPPAPLLDLPSAPPPFYFLQYAPASETPAPNRVPDSEPRQRAAAAAATPSPERRAFEVFSIRKDFPILAEPVNGRQLVWLDNAATTQKPQAGGARPSPLHPHPEPNTSPA